LKETKRGNLPYEQMDKGDLMTGCFTGDKVSQTRSRV
jgi:hypothetical protein